MIGIVAVGAIVAGLHVQPTNAAVGTVNQQPILRDPYGMYPASSQPAEPVNEPKWDPDLPAEDLELLKEEWERSWLDDQPSEMTPFRTHGGVI